MVTSTFHSDESGDRPELPAESPAARCDPTADAGLLEQVLRETLSVAEETEQLEPAYLEALREVGRRYQGQPLTLEPVATTLVRTVLATRFGHLEVSSQEPSAEPWQTMARQIAATLLDDPQAHRRLEAFWARLSEAAR
jgi:hypothetical protein